MFRLNFMLKYVYYVIIIKIEQLCDSGLLFYNLSKKELRGNFGSILDLLGIPNQSGH